MLIKLYKTAVNLLIWEAAHWLSELLLISFLILSVMLQTTELDETDVTKQD